MKRPAFSALLFVLCFAHGHAHAKELDQFTDRRAVLDYYAGGYRQLKDAPGPERVDAVLDARMNELLDQLLRALNDDPPRTLEDREAHVSRVFQHRYLPELVTPYEEWVKHDAHVPLYKVRDKGIYGRAVDYDDARLTWYIELSPILQVSGVLIGLDKLGHFLAQGFQYCERYRALASTPRAERLRAVRSYGHAQELGRLGVATGGVYSFADLAANWAGMTFFLSLFEDVELEGERHARYFERTHDGRYRRVRDFHWAEWVTADWDEVLNPSAAAERALFSKVTANAQHATGKRKSICARYREDPDAYLGPRRALRPRSHYALPEKASAAAPFALDVRALCVRMLRHARLPAGRPDDHPPLPHVRADDVQQRR